MVIRFIIFHVNQLKQIDIGQMLYVIELLLLLLGESYRNLMNDIRDKITLFYEKEDLKYDEVLYFGKQLYGLFTVDR